MPFAIFTDSGVQKRNKTFRPTDPAERPLFGKQLKRSPEETVKEAVILKERMLL